MYLFLVVFDWVAASCWRRLTHTKKSQKQPWPHRGSRRLHNLLHPLHQNNRSRRLLKYSTVQPSLVSAYVRRQMIIVIDAAPFMQTTSLPKKQTALITRPHRCSLHLDGIIEYHRRPWFQQWIDGVCMYIAGPYRRQQCSGDYCSYIMADIDTVMQWSTIAFGRPPYWHRLHRVDCSLVECSLTNTSTTVWPSWLMPKPVQCYVFVIVECRAAETAHYQSTKCCVRLET
jgi:hypothetical protein